MMSDDLPDPDTPVTTVIHSSGILTLIFLRLFSTAPYISMNFFGDLVTGFRRVTDLRSER